jgi:hypothetical protein
MSETDPVEVAAVTIRNEEGCGCTLGDQWVFCDAEGLIERRAVCECKTAGRAVIASLEREGFKLMRREPTEEMVSVAYQTIHLALANKPMTPMEEYATAFRIMVDAAPSYAPVETAESGR